MKKLILLITLLSLGFTQKLYNVTDAQFPVKVTIGYNGSYSGGLYFVASDNDLANININTSDQLLFANASGGYSFDGDVNLSGNYLLDSPDLNNISSRGAVYSFDGSNDYINTNEPFQSTFQNPFSFLVKFKLADGQPASTNTLVGARATGSNQVRVQVTTAGKLEILYKENGNGIDAISTDVLFSDGEESWHTAVATFDGTSGLMYLDGDLIDATTTDMSAATMSSFASNYDLYVGALNQIGSGTNFTEGELDDILLFNHALTATEVNDFAHGNIPYKYQWGSQTALITGDNSTFTTGLGDWSADNDWNSQTNPANNMVLSATAADQRTALSVSIVANKSYRLSYDASSISGTVTLDCWTGTYSNLGTFSSGTGNTLEFTTPYNMTVGKIYIKAAAGGAGITLDNLTLVQIGATLALDPSGFTATTAYDLANGNDGSVSGATLLNYAGLATDGTDSYIDGDLTFLSGNYTAVDEVRAIDGDGLKLYDDGGNGIFVEDGGNVGIGTGSPDAELAGTVLHVAETDGSNISHLNLTGGSGADGITIGSIEWSDPTDTNERLVTLLGQVDGTGTPAGGKFAIYTQADGGSLTQRLAIDESGNVGIGTSTPAYYNSADVTLTLEDQRTNKYPIIELAGGRSAGGNQNGAIRFFNLNGTDTETASIIGMNTVFSADEGQLTFWTHDGSSNAERVRINEDGKVGIASTAPDKQLEINSATGDNLRLTYNDADGSAANYVDYTVSSGGNGTITPSGGALGLGVTPETWNAGYNVMQINDVSSIGQLSAGSHFNIIRNSYLDASAAWRTLETGQSTLYQQNSSGEHIFSVAASSTDDALINGGSGSWTTALTIDNSANSTFGGDVVISNSNPPASAGATGTAGTIAWDSNYIYVCVATNTWKRSAISTW